MISLPEEYVYEIVNIHLNELISTDITETYNNIKNFTIVTNIYLEQLYAEISKYMLISEATFMEFITTYFTDPVYTHVGRLLNSVFIGTDLVVGSIASGGVSSGLTAFFTSVFTKLGLAGTATWAAPIAAGVVPLLFLIIIFGYYNKVKFSDIRNVKTLSDSLNKLSVILKFRYPEMATTIYKDTLKTKCVYVKDKKDKIECAIVEYIKYLNSNIMSNYIKAYIKYLKENNENISDIRTFSDLINFNSKTNPQLTKLNKNFSNSYFSLLKLLKKKKNIIGDSFLLLNRITQSNLK